MGIKHEIKKESKIKLVEEFYRKFGKLPSQSQIYKGVKLGQFLTCVKRGFTHITKEQLNRLLALGFDMRIKNLKERQEEKESKIKLVEEFHKKFRRLPKGYEKYKGVALGRYLNSIKCKDIYVTEDQLERLLALGFDIKTKDVEEEKERKIKLVEEFYKEFKRLPQFREVYKGVKIGVFLNNIRNNTQITKEQLKRLTALGFCITSKDVEAEKMRKIRLVEEFYREYGRLPKQIENYKEVEIGRFLNSIRRGNTQITEDQMVRLKKIGFQGQINDMRVERSIQKIEQFYEKMGRIPTQDETLGKRKIGEILVQIRIGKVRITESQFLRLQQMDATLTREQVSFFEKPKTLVKK